MQRVFRCRALCDGEKRCVDEAFSTYKAARMINGYAGRARILFDELSKADTQGMLKDVRAFWDIRIK
jgi:hypothetical protein